MANSLHSVGPKLRAMAEDEESVQGDGTHLKILNELVSLVLGVMKKYQLCREGNFEAAGQLKTGLVPFNV